MLHVVHAASSNKTKENARRTAATALAKMLFRNNENKSSLLILMRKKVSFHCVIKCYVFEKIDDKVDKEAIGVASLMLDSLNQVCFVFEK